MREPYNPAHGIRYEKFVQSFKDIYRYEGVPGLYSGMPSLLLCLCCCASRLRLRGR